MCVPVYERRDDLIARYALSPRELHHPQLLVKKIGRAPVGPCLKAGDRPRELRIRASQFDSCRDRSTGGYRYRSGHGPVDEAKIFRIFAITQRAVSPGANGIRRLMIVGAGYQNVGYAKPRVNKLPNLAQPIVVCVGVVANQVKRYYRYSGRALIDDDSSSPEIIVLSGGGPIVTEACEVYTVILTLGAGIKCRVCRIIVEGLSGVPFSVMVEVLIFLAPHS